MYTDDAIKFFGSKTKLSKATGVSQSTVSHWVKDGFITKGSAAVAAAVSGGKLKFDPEFYERLKLERKAIRKGLTAKNVSHNQSQGSNASS
ncbi:Cro/CI family transcriptional regulator [Pantoea sp. BAV 3049]|uniref:Cro/CI family transcriptional regulator n=1 Tax=Pantoea sp. BAV 3049 TaxID=2654188 RepID=UPI00131DDE56|nr:Cro/CI family transcriptional regulator [Pantoea sp. BAV 3049]